MAPMTIDPDEVFPVWKTEQGKAILKGNIDRFTWKNGDVEIINPLFKHPALQRLSSTWDGVVQNFLAGGLPWNEELEPWVRAYTGKSVTTKIADSAIPEPFNGHLNRKPKAVLLALNPGQAFLGNGERWMGKQLMPDLQSRQGKFARDIEQCGGSYTTWAQQPFDWPELNGGSPHPFVTARMRFVNDWLAPELVEPDEVVWFDLYPWHSKSWSSIDVRSPEVRHLIDLYVAQPLAALEAPAFAFGKPWFDVLPAIGFEMVKEFGGPDNDSWVNQTPSRRVGLFENAGNGCRVIAMRHSGSAGPPKQSEVPSLRDLVTSALS
jgi:hypothetical protein